MKEAALTSSGVRTALFAMLPNMYPIFDQDLLINDPIDAMKCEACTYCLENFLSVDFKRWSRTGDVPCNTWLTGPQEGSIRRKEYQVHFDKP